MLDSNCCAHDEHEESPGKPARVGGSCAVWCSKGLEECVWVPLLHAVEEEPFLSFSGFQGELRGRVVPPCAAVHALLGVGAVQVEENVFLAILTAKKLSKNPPPTWNMT